MPMIMTMADTIIITTITVMATAMIATITMITPPVTPGCSTAAPIRRAKRSPA